MSGVIVCVFVNAQNNMCLCVLFVTYCVMLYGLLCCVVCVFVCVFVCSMCCVVSVMYNVMLCCLLLSVLCVCGCLCVVCLMRWCVAVAIYCA